MALIPSAVTKRQDHHPRIGRTELGGYKLLGHLGAGSVAEAFLAQQLGTDRQAVVKIALHRLMVGDRAEQVRERFSHELRASTSVAHPNLVTIFTAGTTGDGLPAIAMEFVPGDTLESLLTSAAPLLADDLSYLPQLASALATIHRRGMLHGDVTPGNIIIGRDHLGERHATLLNFGLPTMPGADALLDDQVRAPHYLAPEQLLGHPSSASDIFSLGASLWWALTGTPYLADLQDTNTLLHHQMNAEQPQDPRELAPAIPRALAQLSQSMLHADVRRRPTAEQLLERWPDCVARLASTTPSGPLCPPAAPISGKRGERLKVLVVEPNTVVRHMVGAYLRRLGCDVSETDDPRVATRALPDEHDVVWLAHDLPNVSVEGVVDHLREHFPDVRLVLTAAPHHAPAQQLLDKVDISVQVPGGLSPVAKYLRSISAEPTSTPRDSLANSSNQALNHQAAKRWRDRPREEFTATFDHFVGVLPELIAQLDDSLGDGLSERARHACGGIERAAGALGAYQLGRLAATFRMLAKAGELPNPRAYIDELEAEYARVFQALSALRSEIHPASR